MTTDHETSTSGQPHLAKQSLAGLDVGKLTPLSPEVRTPRSSGRNKLTRFLKYPLKAMPCVALIALF